MVLAIDSFYKQMSYFSNAVHFFRFFLYIVDDKPCISESTDFTADTALYYNNNVC
jgi:hypothetical protein